MKTTLNFNKNIICNLLIKDLIRYGTVFYIYRKAEPRLSDYFTYNSKEDMYILNCKGFAYLLENYEILPYYIKIGLRRMIEDRLAATVINEVWSVTIYNHMGNIINRLRPLIKEKLDL